MKAWFFNANSLKAHITTFRQFLFSHPTYHLFGIAESRLGPNIGDDFVEIEGYSIIRQDRNTHGGGVINSDLDEALEQHSVGFAHRIVMGDLNANMLITGQESTFVKYLACQLNLKLVENGATNHQNRKSHTWIDVIFIDHVR